MTNERAQKIVFKEVAVKPGVKRAEWHGGPFTAVLYRYDPGSVFPEHSHGSAQLTTVLEGRIAFSVAGETFELGPGETLYLPADAPHGATVPADSGPVLSVNVFYPPRKEHP